MAICRFFRIRRFLNHGECPLIPLVLSC